MSFLNTRTLFSALVTGIFLLSVYSCNNSNNGTAAGPCFTINGTIDNAGGKTIYLANESLAGTIILDSAKIGDNGEFTFSQPRPESFEFYIVGFRNGTPAVIAIDSTETVTLTADADDFAGYAIENSSESEKVKELYTLVRALEKQISAMKPDASFMKKKAALLEEFKENIAKQYIVPAPYRPSAYLALWLTMKGETIFKPMENRTDSKCYAAVATGMKMHYPDAQRTKHLCSIAEEGMKATRPITKQEIEQIESLTGTASTSNLFEIRLPNRDGDSISLSSLKGKVVLLDFTLFEYHKMKMRNIDLREIHDRYSKKGLEIYQVSLDSREHYWQQETVGLPWKCVRDGRGNASPYLLQFNVQSLPTFYLIDRNGEIVMRDTQAGDLAKEIEKLLKK